MKYTKEKAQAIAKKLREMPPVEKKQNLSKQEMVRLNAKEIQAMKKRGYTFDQIAHTLTEEGLPISTATLRNYLQRAKPAKKAPAKKPGDTPTAARDVNRQADTSQETSTSTFDITRN